MHVIKPACRAKCVYSVGRKWSVNKIDDCAVRTVSKINNCLDVLKVLRTFYYFVLLCKYDFKQLNDIAYK